jgi:hypothetical protein
MCNAGFCMMIDFGLNLARLDVIDKSIQLKLLHWKFIGRLSSQFINVISEYMLQLHVEDLKCIYLFINDLTITFWPVLSVDVNIMHINLTEFIYKCFRNLNQKESVKKTWSDVFIEWMISGSRKLYKFDFICNEVKRGWKWTQEWKWVKSSAAGHRRAIKTPELARQLSPIAFTTSRSSYVTLRVILFIITHLFYYI